MKINPTTYCTYGSKKNEPKPSLIVIMAARKNKPTLTTYCTYDNTKKWITIEFLLLSM
jgi:hypothetical protein